MSRYLSVLNSSVYKSLYPWSRTQNELFQIQFKVYHRGLKGYVKYLSLIDGILVHCLAWKHNFSFLHTVSKAKDRTSLFLNLEKVSVTLH